MVKLRLKNIEHSEPEPVAIKKMGTVVEWNDERGFGFIAPDDGGRNAFLHVTGLTRESRRPVVGDIFFYTLSSDAKGRPRAIEAYSTMRPERRNASFSYESGRLLGYCSILGLIIVATLVLMFQNCLCGILLGTLINSLLTMKCYISDKYFAQQKIWRLPEKFLHSWELFWGWPGAFFAQRKFRHKNAKVRYQITFWLCVILNCIASYWLISHVSNGQLRQISDYIRDNFLSFIG